MGQIATDGVCPTLTFLLDLDPSTAAGRRDREPDRMEQRGHRPGSRAGRLLAEARRCPETIVVIDASPDPEQVQAAVRQAAQRALQGEAT